MLLSHLTFGKSVDRTLSAAMAHWTLPYGRHGISEKAVVSTFGAGYLLVERNCYRRRIYYQPESDVWIQFNFDSEETGLSLDRYELVQLYISKKSFHCPRFVPTRRIGMSASLLQCFGKSIPEVKAEFFKQRWNEPRANAGAMRNRYLPSAGGVSLRPAIQDGKVLTAEFFFNKGKLAVIMIQSL